MTRVGIQPREAEPCNTLITDLRDFGGIHCESSALRKLLRFHGANFSEPMLFGLGGGIGFVYWQDRRMALPFIGGRNGKFPEFVQQMGQRTGNTIKIIKTRSAASGYRNLIRELERNRPVVCYGDIHYLPYIPTERHFGGHAFVVYGVDELAGEVYISDTSPVPQRISIAALAKARGSVSPPLAPHHAQLAVTEVRSEQPDAHAIRAAIARCCEGMLRAPIRNLGLAGLDTFACQVQRWIACLDATRLVDHLSEAYVNLELAGTGGVGFRKLYRLYLDEARTMLPSGSLDDAIEQLDIAIAAWQALYDFLLPAESEPLGTLRRALNARSPTIEQWRLESASVLANDRRCLEGAPDAIRDVRVAEARFFDTLSRV